MTYLEEFKSIRCSFCGNVLYKNAFGTYYCFDCDIDYDKTVKIIEEKPCADIFDNGTSLGSKSDV